MVYIMLRMTVGSVWVYELLLTFVGIGQRGKSSLSELSVCVWRFASYQGNTW